MKVVWICHVTNSEIQEKLGVKNNLQEFAPWIQRGIKEFSKSKDIELHLISPHKFIKGIKEFKENNIHYHFFNIGIPFLGRNWPYFFRYDYLTDFRSNRKKISSLIKIIKPDLVHLHGTENSYYSLSILDLIKKYPHLVTIQGLISSVSIDNKSWFIKYLAKKEKMIISRCKNFGVRTNEMKSYIKKINPSAEFFWHEYFINFSEKKSLHGYKKYDLIYFGRITKVKGIEDAVKVVSILKKEYKTDIKMAVVGGGNSSYINDIKKMIIDEDCIENIDLFGFLKTQSKVYEVLSNSKISILPTYFDTVPGTIIESMLSKIPVVTYNTGGIPEINEDGEKILISEKGNLQKLAQYVVNLLEDKDSYNYYSKKSYKYAMDRWSNKKTMLCLISIYKKLVDDYNLDV